MARKDFDPSVVQADGRPASRARLFDPATGGPWRGSVAGLDLNGAVTVLAYGTDETGVGPRLHVHPYDETFVVIEGRARFYVGDTVLDASAGEVVFGPAGVPHKFENLGPGRLQTIDIHHSPTWIQTDLE
jgi:mannose-6-phosphate isomerase-like protein (cupin superfamily)